MRYVTVKFLSTKDERAAEGHVYKDGLSRALKRWDIVIVPTRYGLSIAVVKDTHTEEQAKNILNASGRGTQVSSLKLVSEKIKSKVVDEELKLEKADAIKMKLEAEIKKIDEVEKYRVYADLNPAVAEMLAELEELRG